MSNEVEHIKSNLKFKDSEIARLEKEIAGIKKQLADAKSQLTKKKQEVEKPVQKVETKPVTPTYNKILKVCVGKYATVEQARVAQSILQDSDVGVSSFIKMVNGSYTLQVGSFTERSKAEQLLNELLRNSFPARIIQE